MAKRIITLLIINVCVITGVCYSQSNESDTDSETKIEKLKGFLLISASVDSFYVAINDNFEDVYHITKTDTISLEQGAHKVRIFQKYYRDTVSSIDVRPDTLTRIDTVLLPFRDLTTLKYYSSYPRVYWDAPIMVKTDPDASLYIDGDYIGTGIGRISKGTGYFSIRSELPTGQIITESFYADNSKYGTFLVKEFYHRPEKLITQFLSLIPGASQIYKGTKIKGYTMLGASILGTGISLYFHTNYVDNYNKFKDTQVRYKRSNDPNRAFELGDLASKQLDDATTNANLRDVFLYGTIGIYVYSLIDGLIKPKIGYREKIKLDPYVEFDDSYRRRMGLSASYNF